jgi:aspartokinase
VGLQAYGSQGIAGLGKGHAKMIVHKYGGTSLATTDRIRVVAEHIARSRARHPKMVVVVSAMGHHTDELESLAYALSDDPQKRELDMLLTVGERVSMALVSIALHEEGVRAISLTGSQSGIHTDEVFGNARIMAIQGDRLRQALKEYDVVIVAGFQGVNPTSKEVTTLGKGGSDLTAVALAHYFGNCECEIYTDVNGIYSADPRVDRSAELIERMSWMDAYLLSLHGANVLHARAALLAAKFKIPFRVRSSFDFPHEGTWIGESSDCVPARATLRQRVRLQGELKRPVDFRPEKMVYGAMNDTFWDINCDKEDVLDFEAIMNLRLKEEGQLRCHLYERPQGRVIAQPFDQCFIAELPY